MTPTAVDGRALEAWLNHPIVQLAREGLADDPDATDHDLLNHVHRVLDDLEAAPGHTLPDKLQSAGLPNADDWEAWRLYNLGESKVRIAKFQDRIVQDVYASIDRVRFHARQAGNA